MSKSDGDKLSLLEQNTLTVYRLLTMFWILAPPQLHLYFIELCIYILPATEMWTHTCTHTHAYTHTHVHTCTHMLTRSIPLQKKHKFLFLLAVEDSFYFSSLSRRNDPVYTRIQWVNTRLSIGVTILLDPNKRLLRSNPTISSHHGWTMVAVFPKIWWEFQVFSAPVVILTTPVPSQAAILSLKHKEFVYNI